MNSNDQPGGGNPFADLNSFFRGFGSTGGGGAFGFSGRGFPGFSIPTIYRLDMHLEDLYKGKKLNIPVQIGANQERIDINIEPGMATGYELLVRNVGSNAYAGGGRDIIFRINELKHNRFTRNSNDLLVDVNITLQEALFGFYRSLNHLDGHEVWFKSPKNEVIQADDVFVIEGEGMPIYSREYEDLHSGYKRKGNLFIRIRLSMPQHFATHTPEAKSLKFVFNATSFRNDNAVMHRRRLLHRFRDIYCELTGECPLYSSEVDEFDLSPAKVLVAPITATNVTNVAINKNKSSTSSKTWKFPRKRLSSSAAVSQDDTAEDFLITPTNELINKHMEKHESGDFTKHPILRLPKPNFGDNKTKIISLKRSDLKKFGSVGGRSSRTATSGGATYSRFGGADDEDDVDYEESFQRFFFR